MADNPTRTRIRAKRALKRQGNVDITNRQADSNGSFWRWSFHPLASKDVQECHSRVSQPFSGNAK